MKKLIFSITLIACSFSIFGQERLSLNMELYKSVKWEETPEIHTLDEKYAEEAAVIIKDKRVLELYIEKSLFSQSEAASYMTVHKIIRVNTDVGIEKFNKVAIPMYYGESLIELKVRTIASDNSIQEFDKRNLKKITNSEGYSNYRIFAVEGAQKGGEIEYKYTIKQKVKTVGREIYQEDVPIVKAEFKFHAPLDFQFATKSYNGFPEAKMNEKSANSYTAIAENIPGLTKEGYSSYRSKLMRIDYKMESNPYDYSGISWKSISKNMFSTIYEVKGGSKVRKFLKKIGIKGKSTEEKIILVEKAIKEQFKLENSGKEEYSQLPFIMKNRVGNRIGIARAYAKCFATLGIEHSLVLTNSRFSGKIDPDFSHYMDLNEVLFYFPKYDKYIAPHYLHLRYGVPPAGLSGTKGLAISYRFSPGSTILAYKSNVIGNIPFVPGEENNMGVNAEVKIDLENAEAIVKVENFSQGYRAYSGRYFFSQANEKAIEGYQKNVITSAIKDAKYTSFSLENEDTELSLDPTKYFNIHAEFTSQSLMQEAGNDILVSIGKVIGKQNELYEEKDRTTDVILSDTKRYKHQIKLEIPTGYTCQGLEQLKIHNEVLKDGEPVMLFDSDYTLTEKQLLITIHENYDILELDKKFYNDYRKVINSAADFNKIVLVLEPKS